jgi:hypothetical protein
MLREHVILIKKEDVLHQYNCAGMYFTNNYHSGDEFNSLWALGRGTGKINEKFG